MPEIRIGLIGCGGMMQHHAGKLVAMPQVKITALVDTSPDHIKSVKTRFPALQDSAEFADYRQMLKAGLTDAVLIGSPHTCHFEQIMNSLDSNQHVLCEKPMVCSIDHAREVLKKVDTSKKVFLLAYQRHFSGGFRWIKTAIAQGLIGDVQFVQALQCQDWLRFTKGLWRQQHSLSGGGQLNDSGSHLVDIILWTTGLSVQSVAAYCDNFGTEVDINSALALKFTNGAQGNISVIGNCPGWWEDLTYIGSKGAIYSRNGKITHVSAENGTTSELVHAADAGDPDRNFINAILGTEQVQAPALCGLRVIELTEAAWQSAKLNGAPVTVPKTAV
ncbi:MAG TPA: Gfo/Idh/MocA family oxidoreductase [Planctomycetota bacterium]|nr:Gfo/Idh/MocA family oxidoreductase [Planctomycetota bacterium]